jgi:hypothetical protein
METEKKIIKVGFGSFFGRIYTGEKKFSTRVKVEFFVSFLSAERVFPCDLQLFFIIFALVGKGRKTFETHPCFEKKT